jgi:Fe-S-cluster containining protein
MPCVLESPSVKIPSKVLMDCSACNAKCCRFYDVDLTKEDIERIAKHLDRDDFYVRSGSCGILKRLNSVCVFLKDDKCSIYSVRPSVCKEYGCASDKHLQ